MRRQGRRAASPAGTRARREDSAPPRAGARARRRRIEGRRSPRRTPGRAPDGAGRRRGGAPGASARARPPVRSAAGMGTSVRELLDILPFAVGIRSVADGSRWTYVNVAMSRLLGYDTSEALLETLTFDIVDERDRADAIERRLQLLRGERPRFAAVRWRRRDGSVLPMEITAAVIDFDGERAIMIVGRDLSERTELRDRLAVAERMASLGTLAAGVAHEINNPLTYLALSLDRVERELAAVAGAASGGR